MNYDKHPNNNILNQLSFEELRELQNERLQHLVAHVYKNIPYYKKAWEEQGIKPEQIKSVEDLPLLPFTHKSALRDNYPFGLFASPKEQIARLHCSSGTTGKPIVVGYTKNDLSTFSEVVARSLQVAGCQPGMLLQNAYGYGLFTGGLGIHGGAEALGMGVLPISGGGTEKQIMLMQDFNTDVICCTPSYALTLAEAIRKKGIAPSEVSFKYAILGAEPWTESLRKEIEEGLGVKATNIYGLSEVMGPGVAQEAVEEKGAGSYIWEDHFYPEIVDKDTGAVLPYGSQGVLVFTSLTKEATPVVRYWTNDITSIYYDKSARLPFIKMGPIVGRADDMLIIRGVNLFHTQVEAALSEISHLSNNYQLHVEKQDNMDAVTVIIELEEKTYSELAKDHSQPLSHDICIQAVNELQQKIKADIGLSMRIELKEPYAIPRSEGGKLNRIVDHRQK